MEETREEQGKKYAKLIAKAWSDESFKERLLSDSRAVLEQRGSACHQELTSRFWSRRIRRSLL